MKVVFLTRDNTQDTIFQKAPSLFRALFLAAHRVKNQLSVLEIFRFTNRTKSSVREHFINETFHKSFRQSIAKTKIDASLNKVCLIFLISSQCEVCPVHCRLVVNTYCRAKRSVEQSLSFFNITFFIKLPFGFYLSTQTSCLQNM